jgi:anthranilate synthase/aminodeoxychorismate synthase-like glutamine amidotransferase
MSRNPKKLKIALIDHYDSFTFNVIEWLKSSCVDLEILRIYHDDLDSMNLIIQENLPVVLSPGPNTPSDVNSTMTLCQKILGKSPILGICLGHQILGLVAGLKLQKAVSPFHGSVATIDFDRNDLIYSEISSPLDVAIYHSLVVENGPVKKGWKISATCSNKEIMGLTYDVVDHAKAFGMQYHPESFLSEQSDVLLKNFLDEVSDFSQMRPFNSSEEALIIF